MMHNFIYLICVCIPLFFEVRRESDSNPFDCFHDGLDSIHSAEALDSSFKHL